MRIFTCNSCSKIHLEVENTQIHFASAKQLKLYLDYLVSIDVDYYAAINRKKGLSKVIIIPLNECASVHLGFTVDEFEALKKLISNYLSNNSNRTNSFVSLKEFQMMNLN
jgi:hypothetical protein